VVIRIVLVKLWTRYAITRLLRAQQARVPPLGPASAGASEAPPSGTEAVSGSQPGAVWDALDDRQLTRLLTNAAPRTIIE
jgi:hypothetical protein